MRAQYYRLDGRTPVAVSDVIGWARAFESIERIVAKTQCASCEVSTVFLGLDHNFSGVGEPLLFETMVFGGELEGEQERYSTWEEAEAGHKAMVERVAGAAKVEGSAMSALNYPRGASEAARVAAVEKAINRTRTPGTASEAAS